MVSETHANGSRERTQRTVALDQSALLEVLDALKVADVDDRILSSAASDHCLAPTTPPGV
jgi:hypothetical protein